MPLSKKKIIDTCQDETGEENSLSLTQGTQMPLVQESRFDRFVKYYAKFMIIMGTIGQSVFYLQAYKIFIQKSAVNVSLEGFAISFFSLSGWLIYGLLIRDKVLVIVNIIGVAGAAAVILAILKFA